MKKVNIYGGGPTSLIIAHQLHSLQNVEVHIYERNNRTGRKFLVAGKGGFNLSNSINIEQLIQMYSPKDFMDSCLKAFNNNDLQDWLLSLEIETFIGSSGRIFPLPDIKPIQVLNAILNPLKEKVNFHYNHLLTDWTDKGIEIKNNKNIKICEADFHIFCLGGGSWSKTGSDGTWLEIFKRKGINVHDFAPSNCGLEIDWSEQIKSNHIGKPLKNISVSFEDMLFKGEAVISEYGLEGNAIYPIASSVQKRLSNQSDAFLKIDFKPQWTLETLRKKLVNTSGNRASQMEKIGLSRAMISILKNQLNKEEWLDDEKLIPMIKSCSLKVNNLRSIEESISTTGGIDVEELNENFELKKFNNHYCAGEMVDWDTITGGFLLQGCFSMGYTIGQHIKKKIS